jgi:hypothetical protein
VDVDVGVSVSVLRVMCVVCAGCMGALSWPRAGRGKGAEGGCCWFVHGACWPADAGEVCVVLFPGAA